MEASYLWFSVPDCIFRKIPSMKLPLFPLKSVFFPGETVPLHIFEPRYKELIEDCRREALTFGIPVFLEDTLSYGTEVQLAEVVNTYENGEMDVICLARQVFRIVSFVNPMEGKGYAGGEVEFLDMENRGDPALVQVVLQGLEKLYDLMGLPFPMIPANRFNSYTLAHKMGLSFEQEFELLKMHRETDRLIFIKEHLDSTINVLDQIDRTKAAIEMNGHFKNFDPLDFKNLKI